MDVLKNLSIFLLILIASYISATSYVPVELYKLTFSIQSGSGLFIGYQALAELIGGFVIAYTFFTPLFFTSFNVAYRYWWTGVLLLPVIFFVYLDLSHFWFYFLVATVGWLLGFGIHKGLALLKKDKTDTTPQTN